MSDMPANPKEQAPNRSLVVGEAPEVQAIREHLQTTLAEMELWASDPSAAFEQVAEQFYRETGFIAPGKSVPLEMSSVDYDSRRQQRYNEWHLQRRALRHEMMRKAIAALDQQSAALSASREEIARLQQERDEALKVESAYLAITRAISEAVGDGDPSGPYWVDGVRFINTEREMQRQRAEAAETALQALREGIEQKIAAWRGLLADGGTPAERAAFFRGVKFCADELSALLAESLSWGTRPTTDER